jgi:hypothetical protein
MVCNLGNGVFMLNCINLETFLAQTAVAVHASEASADLDEPADKVIVLKKRML